jgi:hypothetical protein
MLRSPITNVYRECAISTWFGVKPNWQTSDVKRVNASENWRPGDWSEIGTNRTNRAGPAMSVDRVKAEVALRGRQDRF